MGQFSSFKEENSENEGVLKNERIENNEGENNYLEYYSSNIQGWKNQNDNTFTSKISQENQKNYDIFCIFVGQNGNEISKFVNNHFYEELLNNINMTPNNIKNSIKQTFLKMNKLMKEKEGKEEIKQLKINNLKKEIEEQPKIINKNESEIVNIELTEDEEEEILDYTGCTACLILIDENNNKLYFGNLGNSEVLIYGKKEIFFESSHRPTDDKEKERIEKLKGLIINDKLFGVLNSTHGLGNFAYNSNNKNKILSDEPDILEYNINEDDYIFMGTESIIECIDKKNFGDILKNKDNSLKETFEKITKDNIAYDFYNNDSEFGFDNITCTLIKIKSINKKEA